MTVRPSSSRSPGASGPTPLLALRPWLLRMSTSGTVWTAGTQLGSAGLALISSPLLARTIGADGRGSVASVAVTLTMLTFVAYLGAPESAGFFSDGRRSSLVTTLALLAALLGVVAAGLLWWTAPLLVGGHDGVALTGLRAGSLLLPLGGVALCAQEALYAHGRLVAWNLLRASALVVPALGTIGLYLTGHLSTGTAIAATLAGTGTYCVLGTVLALRQLRWPLATSELRAPLLYGLQRYLTFGSSALFLRLDQLVMVPLALPAELGRYAVTVTVVQASGILSSAIGVVAYPASRSSVAADRPAAWLRARRRILGVSAATGAVVASTGWWVVPHVFGDQFHGLAPVLVVLVVNQLLGDLWSLDVNTLNGVGRQRTTITPAWVATGLCLVLLLALSHGGITALEAAACTTTSSAVRLLWFRRAGGGMTTVLRSTVDG